MIDDVAITDHEVKIQALSALVWLEGSGAKVRLEAMRAHSHPELRKAAVRHLDRLFPR